MPKFDVHRIAKVDLREHWVRVEAVDVADAQRVAMDDLYLIGEATPVAEAAPASAARSTSLMVMRLVGALLVILGVMTAWFAQQVDSLAIGLTMSFAGWMTFILAECVELVIRALARKS